MNSNPESAIQAYKFLTNLGVMALAWRGGKIVGVQLPESTEDALLRALRRKVGANQLDWTLSPPEFVLDFSRRIRAHLAGERATYPLSRLALEDSSPFFRRVYEAAARIPAGRTRSYAELAAAAGSPKASRAVGQAMARNPFPIVVPCHRVVGSGKSFGGFTAFGGLGTKSRLLEIETR